MSVKNNVLPELTGRALFFMVQGNVRLKRLDHPRLCPGGGVPGQVDTGHVGDFIQARHQVVNISCRPGTLIQVTSKDVAVRTVGNQALTVVGRQCFGGGISLDVGAGVDPHVHLDDAVDGERPVVTGDAVGTISVVDRDAVNGKRRVGPAAIPVGHAIRPLGRQ